jgi:hypothetical protein
MIRAFPTRLHWGDSTTQTSQARRTNGERLEQVRESGVQNRQEIVSLPCTSTDPRQWLAAQGDRDQRLRWIRPSQDGNLAWPGAG